MLCACEQDSSSHFHHALHIPGLCGHRGKPEIGPEGEKNPSALPIPPPRGLQTAMVVGCAVALSSLSSTRIHFSFPNYNIYFPLKNIPPATVMPCDTQAGEHSLCPTVTAVSSHCPLCPVLGSQLPWWILGWQLLASFAPSQLRVLALAPKARVLTHFPPCTVTCSVSLSSLGSGSGFAVALLHRRALKLLSSTQG